MPSLVPGQQILGRKSPSPTTAKSNRRGDRRESGEDFREDLLVGSL
jgi:hypothetical protein